MDLKLIILREVGQIYDIVSMWNLKKKKELIYITETNVRPQKTK